MFKSQTNTSPKILGVIPARYASTRFPGKMMAHILGKTLIQHTFENACQSTILDKLVIATDDDRIFTHAQTFGATPYMTSIECPSGSDRAAELVSRHFPDVDVVVIVQGDEPCLDPDVIDTLVSDLLEHPDAVMTTPVVPLKSAKDILNPSVVKCVFSPLGRALYFSRSPIPYFQKEQPDISYYRHMGVYCFRRDFLLKYPTLSKTPLQRAEDLEQLKIIEHGYPIYVSIVDDDGIGVDTWEDVKRVEAKLCKENIFSSQEEWSPPSVKV